MKRKGFFTKVLLIFSIFFLLTGCVPIIEKYEFPFKSEKVISMKAYYIDISDIIGIQYKNIDEFNNYDPYYIFEEDEYQNVMNSIESYDFSMLVLVIAAFPAPHEYFQNEVLIVEYEDNYMSIIANSLRCDYHNGECIMYQPYGESDEFTELMNKNK